MISSNTLFELIKSMNRTEKRYFGLYTHRSTQKGDFDYTRLFEAIDEQDSYDEPALKHRFRDEAWVKRFAFVKHYLYRQILRCLHTYHQDKSVDMRLRELMDAAEILYHKALYRQALGVLSKARKIAARYEKFLFLNDVLEWQQAILLHTDPDRLGQNAFFGKQKNCLEKQINIITYKELDYRFLRIESASLHARSHEHLAGIKKILRHPLLSGREKALSNTALITYYFIMHAFYEQTGNYRTCNELSKNLMGLFFAHRELLEEKTSQYISAVHNLLIDLINLGQYEEFKKTVDILRKTGAQSENLKIRIFITSCQLETEMCLRYGLFKQGTGLVPEILENLRLFSDRIRPSTELIFYFNISYLYFGNGEYEQSLNWLNKLLNNPAINQTPELHGFARLLSLIVHYELGHHDLIEYLARSAYSFLLKRKQLHRLEKEVLFFIRKRLPHALDQDMLMESFRDLKIKLEEIASDPMEKKVQEYFDFISWLESKISERPFGEMVRSKAINHTNKGEVFRKQFPGLF